RGDRLEGPHSVVRHDGHRLPGARVHALPVHPAWLGLILLGGMAGTAARAALGAAFAAPGFPWATLGINLSGALILGVILELLSATGPDQGWRRAVRLGVGTGLLGGYTTYATFAVETMTMLDDGAWIAAISYALGSVILGFLAAVLGIIGVRRLLRGRGA
ncbi:MAG: fluoride efflux transporter FluC, partial [Arachnia sp.]